MSVLERNSLSIIKYGDPRCVSRKQPARNSVFTHPRDLEDPLMEHLAAKMSKHGLPRNLVVKKSVRRHYEVVPKEEQMMRHLDQVCPPKEWTEGSMYFVQSLSAEPSSREEAIELMDRIESMLVSRRAKQSGICSIRREIFSQLFDELLRQVSTENLLWGKLLLRIRNEINMTLEAYGALFANSFNFGNTTFSSVTNDTPEMKSTVQQLRDQINHLKCQIEDSERAIYGIECHSKRMEQKRMELEKFNRDRLMKVHQKYIVALDNLKPITVNFKKPSNSIQKDPNSNVATTCEEGKTEDENNGSAEINSLSLFETKRSVNTSRDVSTVAKNVTMGMSVEHPSVACVETGKATSVVLE